MFSWHREGNYYLTKKYDLAYLNSLDQAKVPQDRRIKNNVYFVNRNIHSKEPVTVKSVEVIRYKNNQVFVRFIPSYFKKDEFFKICEKLIKSYKTYYPSIMSNEIEIALTKKALNELYTVFEYFNKTAIEFPDVLQQELEQILTDNSKGSKAGTDVYQHIIPENGIIEDFVNPDREYSDELINLLLKNKTLTQSKVSELLVNGEPPNQSMGMATPLKLALPLFSPEIIRLLLTYGANPNKYDMFYETFTEKVQWYLDNTSNNHEKSILEKIMNMLNSTSSISNVKSLSKIKEIRLASSKNEFNRSIQFTNGEMITTYLKSSNHLDSREKENLFNYFSSVFNTGNSSEKENLKSIFEDDFFGDMHLIEIIKRENQIIGFNVFELMPWIDKENDKNKDHITLHVIYSVLNPAYRGSGLIDLSTFGFAFAIHGVYPSIVTSLYCTAITPASFDVMQFYKFFPKYKTPKISNDVLHLLKKIYGDELKYVDDKTMKSYVIENVGINNHYKKMSHKHFLGELYEAIIDHKNGDTREKRGATLLSHTSDVSNFNTLDHKLARLGVTFRSHLYSFSKALAPFISNILGKTPEQAPFYLYDTADLFWKNKQTPIIPEKPLNSKDESFRYSRL